MFSRVCCILEDDDDNEIRRLAINKIKALRVKLLQHTIQNGNFKRGYIEKCRNVEKCC